MLNGLDPFVLALREVEMDGFRERLNGRYDRSGMRGSGYDRVSQDDRYESDRFDRASRRGAGDGLSQDALSDAVNEVITRSNREQLGIIADYFDEAKADRMESERAIIDAFSHSGAGSSLTGNASGSAVPILVDEQNRETLERIEKVAGRNAELLGESGNKLENNSQTLSEIAGSIGKLISSSEDTKRQIAESVSSPIQDLAGKEDEIIGAVGDNRAILNMIRQDVLNGFAKGEAAEEEAAEKPALLTAEAADNYYKELEDHVHKECVKCYRNVQSALTEQNEETAKGLGKSVSGMRIMVLITLILSAINLLITVLGHFLPGIFPY